MTAKDERVDSFIERMVGLFGLGGFESAYDIPPPLWLNDAQLVRMTKTIVEEVAQRGSAILVGRGGNRILEQHPKALHVFLHAPLEARIARVVRGRGTGPGTRPRQRIAGMDKIRADYVHTFYHGDWRDPNHYTLLLDSSRWGDEGTTDLILWALEHAPS